jgi:hypothetical protein
VSHPGSDNQGWRAEELVPRPDPTKLTTEAVERATLQYRRELSQLRELIETRLDAMDADRALRFGDMQLQMDQRFTSAQKAVETALLSAEKAVTKAETAAEKRFDSVNEFRQAMNDQTRLYMPRTEYEAAHKSLEARMGVTVDRLAALELRLTSRLDRGEGLDAGSSGQRNEQRLNTNVTIAVISTLLLILSIAVTIFIATRH